MWQWQWQLMDVRGVGRVGMDGRGGGKVVTLLKPPPPDDSLGMDIHPGILILRSWPSNEPRKIGTLSSVKARVEWSTVS